MMWLAIVVVILGTALAAAGGVVAGFLISLSILARVMRKPQHRKE